MVQYNFVGRLLGPRGNSLKRVEASTECRILIRGRGSIKDPVKVINEFILILKLRYTVVLTWKHLEYWPLGNVVQKVCFNSALAKAWG